MRNWRVITAIVTVVLAALAGILVYRYVNKADERAQDKVKQVTVLVAKQDIPAGTSGATAVASGMIGQDRIADKNLPTNAITSQVGEAAIKDLVAAATLPKGLVISTDLFVARTQLSGTLQSQLKSGDQAISFSVDQPHGVANLIQVGDSINVIASVSLEPTSNLKGTNQRRHQLTAFLLPGLQVLAVGSQPNAAQAPQPTSGGSSGTTTTTSAQTRSPQNLGLITVRVTPRQAEQLAHVQAFGGTMYVSLNAPGFDPKTFKMPVEIVDTDNLFDQRLTELEKLLAQEKAAAQTTP